MAPRKRNMIVIGSVHDGGKRWENASLNAPAGVDSIDHSVDSYWLPGSRHQVSGSNSPNVLEKN